MGGGVKLFSYLTPLQTKVIHHLYNVTQMHYSPYLSAHASGSFRFRHTLLKQKEIYKRLFNKIWQFSIEFLVVSLVECLLYTDHYFSFLQFYSLHLISSGLFVLYHAACRLKSTILEHFDSGNFVKLSAVLEENLEKDPTCSHSLGRLISYHRSGTSLPEKTFYSLHPKEIKRYKILVLPQGLQQSEVLS